MKRILSCAAILVVAGSYALAAENPPPDTHRQAAEEFIKVIGLEKTMLAGATAAIDAQVQANPAMAPYRDTVIAWAKKFMTWDAFGPKVVAMYAEAFTEPELRDLIAFYKTPTGRKSLATMPDLMRRGAMVGAEVARAHLPDLETMIEERKAEIDKEQPKQ